MTTEELAVKVTEVESRGKSNTHRIDKLEDRQDNLDRLVASVSTLAQEQEHIKDDVTEIKTDVKALTEKPAKRWESVVEKVVLLVVAGVVGFLLAQAGLG